MIEGLFIALQFAGSAHVEAREGRVEDANSYGSEKVFDKRCENFYK